MLQYLLTALAGIAAGVVGVRIWMARDQLSERPQPTADMTDTSQGPATPARTRALVVGAGILAILAAAVLFFRPNDTQTPAPTVVATADETNGQSLADVDTMISQLADRLKANPKDGEGFRMLGWSYVMTGHPEKAIEPYRRALVLLPDQAVVYSGYGEALAGVARNNVTSEAKAEFEKALKLDPSEPRARYFLALWQAQNGEERSALDHWIALANEGPADAPWQNDVHKQIAQISAKLGVDASSRLKSAPATSVASNGPPPLDASTVQAASQMPAGDRQAMIDQMVEGLAEKLKVNPKDADGWVRLLRSRMVLGQSDQASKDLATARKALTADAAGLAKINAAARDYTVPGA